MNTSSLNEKKKYQGSCLCGQVAYEIEGSLDGFYLCHCSRCRKISGTAHAANIFSKGATLKWVSGEMNQKMYNLEGTRFVRNFCITCGSSLPYASDADNTVMIPAGSLDTNIDIRPTAHIFYASRACWDNELEKIEKRDEF